MSVFLIVAATASLLGEALDDVCNAGGTITRNAYRLGQREIITEGNHKKIIRKSYNEADMPDIRLLCRRDDVFGTPKCVLRTVIQVGTG